VILAGLALGGAFARRHVAPADPLIDLRLFRVPAFSASLTLDGIGMLVLFGGYLFVPQYLQLVIDLSPIEAGLLSVPRAMALIAGSLLTPRLASRA
jgi:DHA2 family multidrug resistance protein-like MFS transporter